MTKAELIKALEAYPDDAVVCRSEDFRSPDFIPISTVQENEVVQVEGGYDYGYGDPTTHTVIRLA